MEELPSDVLDEAKWLVRQPFDERCKECKTPADWESFLIDVEADERTTLVDVKMFGERLKLIVDRMAAMAAAEHEIQTEGLLVKAMLHRANYLWQERDKPEKPWQCISGNYQEAEIDKQESPKPDLRDLINDPAFVADEPNTYQDRQWIPGTRKDLYRFVLTYGTEFKKVEAPAFASSHELFDPMNSTAQEFWDWTKDSEYGQPPTAEERVMAAKKEYQISLAHSLVRRASASEVFLPSVRKANESTFEQFSAEALQTESAVGAFPKGINVHSVISQVKDRISGNVGHSRIPEKQPDAIPQLTIKPREYPESVGIGLPCLHIPQERFPIERITATADVPAPLSTYDRLIWRYLRLARRSLDTHFSTENVREHFGVDVVTTDGVKDKLFRELFYDYMVQELRITRDEKGELSKIDHLSTAPTFSQETLNRSQGYAAAVAILPFVSMESPYQDNASTVEGEYLSYEIGRAEGLDSLDGILSRFDLLNFVMHDPRYGSPYSSFIGNNTTEESWGAGDANPDKVVSRGHNLTDVKRHLFKKLLDLSVSSTTGTAASPSQRTGLFRSSLKERAATQGVPVEAVGVVTGIRSLFHSKLQPKERESLVRFWMQEYFNTIAESPEEMNQAAHQLGSWEALL